MATGFASWSKTAASNATADSAVNWAEGQAPSSVNDSARAMMASAAKWRDDISGAITTGGTSTAFTATTNQSFASLAAMNAQIITIVPHATSGADPTLAVDGLTAKQIRTATCVNVPTGSLVAGTPYALVYFSAAGEFILLGFDANPYMIPLGGVMPYIGATAPHTSYALAYGQAISRTTYATLFSLVGTTFGTGDGSTTFNIPDLRDRVIAGKGDMGGVAANRLDSSTTLGATQGAKSHTLVEAEVPLHTHTEAGHIHAGGDLLDAAVLAYVDNRFSAAQFVSVVNNTGGGNTDIASVSLSSFGGSGAHANVQPTIILNYILRII